MTTGGYSLADLDIEFEPWIHRDGGEPEDDDRTRAVVSGIWRAGEGMDWLGADYLWDQLDCAHELLSRGFEDSGIESGDNPALCDEHDFLSAPGASVRFGAQSGQPLRLVTLEVTSKSINPCWEGCPTRNHGESMHNSGSDGPP